MFPSTSDKGVFDLGEIVEVVQIAMTRSSEFYGCDLKRFCRSAPRPRELTTDSQLEGKPARTRAVRQKWLSNFFSCACYLPFRSERAADANLQGSRYHRSYRSIWKHRLLSELNRQSLSLVAYRLALR